MSIQVFFRALAVTTLGILASSTGAQPDGWLCEDDVTGRFGEGQYGRLIVEDGIAYCSAFTPTEEWELQIYDLNDPDMPKLLGVLPSFLITDMRKTGDLLYSVGRTGGFQVIDVSDATQPAAQGSVNTSGLELAVSGRNAAVVSSEGGITLIDVSDPANPVFKYDLFRSEYPVEDVEIVGETMYLTGEYLGVEIFDLSGSGLPALIGSFAGDMYVDTIRQFGDVLFMVSNTDLLVWDISDQSDPMYLGGHTAARQIREFSSVDESTLAIEVEDLGIVYLDISDPADISVVSRTQTGYPGTFAGGDGVLVMSPYRRNPGDPAALVLDPDRHGAYTVTDVVDTRDDFAQYGEMRLHNGVVYTLVSSNQSGVSVRSLPGSNETIEELIPVGDHWRGIKLSGERLAVRRDTDVLVYDVSNPTDITKQWFSRVRSYSGYALHNDLLAVSPSSGGSLQLFSVAEVDQNTPLSIYETDDAPVAIAMNSQYLFCVLSNELNVLDITDPAKPEFMVSYDLSDFDLDVNNEAVRFEIEDHYLHISDGSEIARLDISDPYAITIDFRFYDSLVWSSLEDYAFDEGLLYTVGELGEFAVYDIADLSAPQLVYTRTLEGSSRPLNLGEVEIAPSGQSALIGTNFGVLLMDLTTNCTQPCLPDTNNDGILSPADFTAWMDAFINNLPECDQNADGSCTPTDFTAWIANFNAGC